MIKLFKYLSKKDYGAILLVFIVLALNVWLELEIFDFMKKITTLISVSDLSFESIKNALSSNSIGIFKNFSIEISKNNDISFLGFEKWIFNIFGGETKIQLILTEGVLMVLCAFGSMFGAIIVNFFASRLAARFGRKLRSEVYKKISNFSPAEIKHFSTPSLITRTTNDITQVQNMLANGTRMIIRAPMMAIMALCKIANTNFMWTLSTVISVVLIVIVISIIIIVAIPKFKKIQLLIDNLNRVTREGLTGTRVIRAFNAEDYQEKKFDEVNTQIKDNNLYINGVMSLMDPAMNFIMSALPLAIYFIGALLISRASDIGEKIQLFSCMTIFSGYAIQVVMSFVILIAVFVMFPRSQVSANRINEVLLTKNSIVDGEGNEKPIKVGEVQFVNVGFKYPDAEEYVLHDISFKAEKGQVVAFIGSTGSGKSTIVNLVPRLYDATEGQVIVDGVNVKEYTIQQLNNKVGYISQKAVMFSGTVKSNIEMGLADGKKPTDESIEKAIDISQSSFVYDLNGGLNAEIDQGGKNISGGQKQRLSIARALARNPEILIFDDSFSALDYKTDKLLRKALKEKSSETTCLIVAQRIGTIIDADKILVLDKGTVVGEGTHSELMENCEVYREIALSQLSKEELENA